MVMYSFYFVVKSISRFRNVKFDIQIIPFFLSSVAGMHLILKLLSYVSFSKNS